MEQHSTQQQLLDLGVTVSDAQNRLAEMEAMLSLLRPVLEQAAAQLIEMGRGGQSCKRSGNIS